MKIQNYGLVLLFFLLNSCATPEPVVRLWPSTIGKTEFWNMGQQFVCDHNGKITYEIGFSKVQSGKVFFNVRITNQSDKNVLVAPEMFEILAYRQDSLLLARTYAYNPEMMMFLLEMQNNQARATAENAAAAAIVTGILLGGAAIAVAASNMEDEKKETASDVIETTGDIVFSSAANESEEAQETIHRNTYQMERFSNSMLRKTTLLPGYYIEGEVQFPYYTFANWYQIILNAGNSSVDFHFRQVIHYPVSYQSTNQIR